MKPRTAAGRALLDRLIEHAGIDGIALDWYTASILAIEAEASAHADALLREALEAVMNTRHSPWIGGPGVFQCACVVHENARAALAATPPASAEHRDE